MTVELRGVEFVNKGAELMFFAIIQQLQKEFGEKIQICMEPSNRKPLDVIRERGIIPKMPLELPKGFNAYALQSLIPSSLYGKDFIKENKIDYVIDASGFAFGDHWGTKKAGKRMANHIRRWKSQGKKVIMLPQAFGPFTEKSLINKMNVIINNADLIFARDKVSYENLMALSKGSSNIYLRPDFTNLIVGKTPGYFDSSKLEVAIIPNYKMISGKTDKSTYVNFLKNCVEIVHEIKLKPFFLMHDNLRDPLLTKEVNSLLDNPIEIIDEDDPLFVKSIIGKSKFVICSRFHGLVSSLSQCIPTLTTGWSHKYKMLLEDYDSLESFINVDITKAELKTRLLAIVNNSHQIKKKLLEHSDKNKDRSREMWRLVFQKLKG